VLLCAGLFFLLVRRRVGDLLAVPPTLVLLFFGSGWETVLTAIRIPSLIAVASGLGSLLMLERRDRHGNIAAAALLTAAVASHPVGLSFLAAAAVIVLGRPTPQRWKDAWLLAIPAAAFGAWWLFLRAPATEGVFSTSPIEVVQFAVDSWTSVTAHVAGLAGVLGSPTFDQTIAQIVAALLFAVLVAVVAIRRGRAPATFWAALVALVVLVAITRLTPSGSIFVRSADELRYRYPEAVLFLLMLMELIAITRPRAWAAVGVTAVLMLGLAYNVDQLRRAGPTARAESERALGQYGAYELAGHKLDQDYQPPSFLPSARNYGQATGRYGPVAPRQTSSGPLADERTYGADASV
jgi:hypothetical protein